MGLAVAKAEANCAVGFSRLRQAGCRINRRAGKGLLQPLEHGSSIDLNAKDARVVSRLPAGVCDMDELVMVVNWRDAATGSGSLVLTRGVGAGVVGWAAVVVDVVGNGPGRHMKAVGQFKLSGAVLGLAHQQQMVAQLF